MTSSTSSTTVPGAAPRPTADSGAPRVRRARRRAAAVAAAALAVGGALAAGALPAHGATAAVAVPGPALALTPDTSWWGTNGRVEDIVTSGTTAWLAGGFDYVGPTTGHAAVVDGATAAANTTLPVIDGTVLAAAPDGAGGTYLGGSFARAGSVRRVGFVHLTATGAVDKRWAATTVSGTATAIAVGADGTVYVASQATGSPARLSAFGADGTPRGAFAAAPDGRVLALEAVGSSVYAAGSFGSISGASAGHVARLDAATGAVDPGFAVRTDRDVYALDVLAGATRADDTVALGGDFSSVTDAGGARPRAHAALVSGAGTVAGWTADTNADVRTVAVDAATAQVFLGGDFTSVAGSPRTYVASVTLAGVTTGFAPALAGCHLPHTVQYSLQYVPCTPRVDSVAVAGSRVYVGGLFTTVGADVRHDAAAFSTTTGGLDPWSPMPGAWVHVVRPAAATDGAPVVLGGDFTSVGGQYHRGIAKLDLTTGQADPSFHADADDLPLDLELSASRLYVAGSFRSVSGVTRSRVAALDPATGAVDPAFTVQPNKTVYSVVARNGKVYLGGIFTKIRNVAHANLARVDATTGTLDTTFTAAPTGPAGIQKSGGVFSIAARQDGTRVFVAGGFTSISGTATPGGLAALDTTTGAVLPNNLGGVQPPRNCPFTLNWITRIYLSPDDQRLYGGDNCPDYVYQWDAVNLGTQKAGGLNWVTLCNAGMQGTLEVNGSFYYGTHGGDRNRGGYCQASSTDTTRVVQQRLFVFRSTDAAVEAWAPQFDAPMGVWSFAVVPQGLLVGGDFSFAGERSTVQQGLALFRGTP